MNIYDSLSDDYFVNMNLYTEMPLPSQRETVLEFFGRFQKSYPTMRNFYTRDSGAFVLEEDKDQPSYRWVNIEERRICSSCVNPTTIDDAVPQHALALELAPYMLSVSPLDCEALDFLIGFDFLYRGNHDELVAEALGMGPAFDGVLGIEGARPLNFEPSVTMALTDDCRRQARLMIETRTNAYQVRREDYTEEPISVYFTIRQYGSLPHNGSFVETLDELRQDCERLLEKHVIEQVLRPLHLAISQK
ncbi:hypothetical protein [Thalassoglobus polymorphus]|uniref:TIGR04255 family protein n=1 Tax=Thalassoglobus polymorphus TaxID=2527994 RepID=A0A517QR58_9PLAN|nr:hypothetical protein [Thalassoglobus polymorphus]QDT34116.1 hypothetical protein Mal48_33760 [Thalassoglobus polymorphus]